MIAVKLDEDHAPRGQGELRRVASPVREEWQQDGTWTALFDVDDAATEAALHETIEAVGGGDVMVTEIESEDEIPGFRMALYLFGAVPGVGTSEEARREDQSR